MCQGIVPSKYSKNIIFACRLQMNDDIFDILFYSVVPSKYSQKNDMCSLNINEIYFCLFIFHDDHHDHHDHIQSVTEVHLSKHKMLQ